MKDQVQELESSNENDTEQSESGQAHSLLFRYPFTELGHSRRFIRLYGKDYRYCPELKAWLHWCGTHWELDTTGQAIRAVKTIPRLLRKLVFEQVDDVKEVARLIAKIETLETSHGLTSSLKLAATELSVVVPIEKLDANQYRLPVLNGVIELTDGKFRPHHRQDYCSKILRVRFDQKAMCPSWVAFLEKVFDSNQELIAYVQRLIGYCLSGDTSEQVIFILHGTGANGKSTLVTMLLELLGPFAVNIPMETLINRKSYAIPNDVARLKGARLAAAAETEDGQRLSEAKVKQMTGGDRLPARFLFKEFFDFVPQFKLMLALNHLPEITGGGYAIWRRLQVIPFSVTIPEGQRDRELLPKLRAELPGILAWAVRGYVEWRRIGLAPPDAVRNAVDRYRESSDVVGEFLEARTVSALSGQETKADLYRAFASWCEANVVEPMRKSSFGRRMVERGYKDGRGSGGTRLWLGLRLKTRPVSLNPLTFVHEDEDDCEAPNRQRRSHVC